MDDSHRNRIQALLIAADTHPQGGVDLEPPARHPNAPDLLVVPRTCRSEWERPPLLGFVTLLGIAGPITGPLLAFGAAGLANLFGLYIPRPIFQNMGDLFPAFWLLSVIGIAPFIGLRLGRYWGWIAVQVLCAIGFLIVPLSELGFGTIPIMNRGASKIPSLLFALLWLYLRTKRVREFCSVGRAIRLSELESPSDDGIADSPLLPQGAGETKPEEDITPKLED